MNTLTSSLFSSEFVAYKREIRESKRKAFSDKVLLHKNNEKLSFLPVIIDSVEDDIGMILNDESRVNLTSRKRRNGKEYILERSKLISEFLSELSNELQLNSYDKKITFGLEDTSIITNNNMTIGELYDMYYDRNDHILYLLITTEDTMFGYIKSIIKYLKKLVWSS
jgi:hypothetical protein